MKVGDIVRLVDAPSVDWMEDYLEETFEIVELPSETGIKVKMVGTNWLWRTGREDFKIAVEEVVQDTKMPIDKAIEGKEEEYAEEIELYKTYGGD